MTTLHLYSDGRVDEVHETNRPFPITLQPGDVIHSNGHVTIVDKPLTFSSPGEIARWDMHRFDDLCGVGR